MEFTFNKEQLAWQKKAREFSNEIIRPASVERDLIADPAKTFDWEIIRKGSQLGFRTLAVPKKWGGHGLDLVTQVLVMVELAKGDASISKTFSQCWKWSQLIAAVCSDEQKERFLKPFIADETYLLGLGANEPSGGSDNRMPPEDAPTAGMRLKAERQGDEWILNGEKCFIANGNIAKLLFVRARTNPAVSVRSGTTLFLVPRDTPGFRVGRVFNKNGWRFYQNAELIFENARIPHSNLVGKVNGGAEARGGDPSQFSDLELGANALGVCDAAVEMAMQRIKQRHYGGHPILEQQAIELKISRMHMLTEALRSFMLRVAWERDQAVAGNVDYLKSANNMLALTFSADTVQSVTNLNMEIHGAYTGGANPAAYKLVRDAIIWTHLAGDSVNRIKGIKSVMSHSH